MEERDPGEAPKACSGRTATTLARPSGDGTNGSATGTGCRGRAVRRGAFGRRVGPAGRDTRRYRTSG